MSSADAYAALAIGTAAFVAALSGAMAPGPYLTVTIARTIQRGWLSAQLMLVGHALLEGALLVGLAFGLQDFLRRPSVATVMAYVGGAVLLWMGVDLLRGALSGAIARELEAAEHPAVAIEGSHARSVAHGALVSLANPWWMLWWATIGLKLAADGLAIGPLGIVAFFIGHQAADWAWYSFIIAATAKGKDLLTPRVYRVIMGVLALFLLYLGALFIASGIGLELPWLPLYGGPIRG